VPFKNGINPPVSINQTIKRTAIAFTRILWRSQKDVNLRYQGAVIHVTLCAHISLLDTFRLASMAVRWGLTKSAGISIERMAPRMLVDNSLIRMTVDSDTINATR